MDPHPNSSIQTGIGEIKEMKTLNMEKILMWSKWALSGDIQNVITVYI